MCTELAVFTRPLCSNVEGDPPGWLVHCDSLHILKIMQTCHGPDKKLNRGIGVVGENIQIDGKFLQQRTPVSIVDKQTCEMIQIYANDILV